MMGVMETGRGRPLGGAPLLSGFWPPHSRRVGQSKSGSCYPPASPRLFAPMGASGESAAGRECGLVSRQCGRVPWNRLHPHRRLAWESGVRSFQWAVDKRCWETRVLHSPLLRWGSIQNRHRTSHDSTPRTRHSAGRVGRTIREESVALGGTLMPSSPRALSSIARSHDRR